MSSLENHFCGAGVSCGEGDAEIVRSWNKSQEDQFVFRPVEKYWVIGIMGDTWVGTKPTASPFVFAVYTTTDLVTWTFVSNLPDTAGYLWNFAVWDNGCLVGIANNLVVRSSDFGVTWESFGISNGTWALGGQTLSGRAIFSCWQLTSSYILVESYGATVSVKAAPSTGNGFIAYKNTFTATASNNTTYYNSTDGINWTTETNALSLYLSTIYSATNGADGRIILISDASHYQVSDDEGVTWTAYGRAGAFAGPTNAGLYVGRNLYYYMYLGGGGMLGTGGGLLTGDVTSSAGASISFIDGSASVGVRPSFRYTPCERYAIIAATRQYIVDRRAFKNVPQANPVLLTQ